MNPTVRLEKITRDAIDLFAQERKVILGGEYDRIEAFTAKKEAFLAEIDTIAKAVVAAPPSIRADEQRERLGSLLGIIARRSEENQRLLAAARDGVEAARARLDALSKPRTEIGAYGRFGEQMKTAAVSGGSLKY